MCMSYCQYIHIIVIIVIIFSMPYCQYEYAPIPSINVLHH